MIDWRKRKPIAAAAKPPDFDDLVQSADARRDAGDIGAAILAYESAHAARPDHVYPLIWLAHLCSQAGQAARARTYVERGLAADRRNVGLLLIAAGLAHERDDPCAALRYYEEVKALDPDVEDIDARLADELCIVGRIEDGLAAFDRALARNPGSAVLQDNRLFCMNYADHIAPEAMFAEHVAWGARMEAAHPPGALESRRPANVPLRVGYLSPDMRRHAVAWFLEPLLQHHDKSSFQIHCFDTSMDPEDTVTARLKSTGVAWHGVAALDDAALHAAIRAAGIDVLVDLSGHTRGNRLAVFARRAAPVQVSWLGYLATTGLRSMDYRLTDPYMDPPGVTEHLYTERLVRLPAQGCFAAPADAPPVTPSPAGRGRAPTFGSVNQWSKVSPKVRSMWGALLARVPEARLLVSARGGHTAEMQALVRSALAREGARPEQIEVYPFVSRSDFYRLLAEIDVALDTFPYGGGTTTFECLWMGVPVVTLAGRTALSRNAIGPLHHAGLADLVAESPDGYIDHASRLGRDTRRLAEIRITLRDRIRASPAMDGRAFARAVEAAYESMAPRA